MDFCKTLLHNPAMKYGYARISTDEQSLALQRNALSAPGCAVNANGC